MINKGFLKMLTMLVVAASLGSGITFGIVSLTQKKERKDLSVNQVPGVHGQFATLNGMAHAGLADMDFTTAAEKAMPSVVHIKATKSGMNIASNRRTIDPFRDFFGDDWGFGSPFFGQPQSRTQISSGSGVIINGEGYIVTNNHVIDRAEEIEVSLHDNRSYKAELVGTDPATDIALIRIKESGLPYMQLVNSDDVKVGEWVMAVGNPFNLNSTVTAGIVSAKARNINILKEKSAIESFIQTDAAVNPGNSGGALVNLNGDLIGINTAIASPTGAYSGYAFAVPANIVSKVVEDLLKYGLVQRGYLGVVIRPMSGKLAEEKGIDFREGVFVDDVSEGSAAELAGLKAGDVIISINRHPIRSTPELQEEVGRHRPGDMLRLEVFRGGSVRMIDVQLKNKNGNTDIVSREELDVLQILGVEVESLTKKEREKLNVEGGVRILEISDGKLRHETQVRRGFIVTHIDGKPIKDEKEMIETLRKKQGGVMMEGIYEGYRGTYYYAFGM